MKTIQQIVAELDMEEVIKYYFYRYPIKLFQDLNEKWENKTVAECKAYGHYKVKALIERIINTKPNADNGQKYILFIHKCMDDGICHDICEGLVEVGELFGAKDVSEVTTYAYGYEKLEDTVGYYVANTALTQRHLLDLVTNYLFVSSFFGYEQEYLEEERQKLDDALEECEDHSKGRSFNTLEELFEDLGITPEETYPEEEEKRNKYHNAVIDYNKYCKGKELERLRESILEVKRGLNVDLY